VALAGAVAVVLTITTDKKVDDYEQS